MLKTKNSISSDEEPSAPTSEITSQNSRKELFLSHSVSLFFFFLQLAESRQNYPSSI